MRPVLDPRLFPGLPKFLWFDDGDGGDGGTGGDSSSAASAAAAAAAANAAGFGGSPGGPSGAPAGTSSTGTGSFGGQGADDGGGTTGSVGGGVTGSVSFGGQGTSNAGANAAAANAAPGGAGGVGTSGATGGGGATSPGAATGGGGGTAAGGSGGVRGMNPAVVNSLISAGLMGVPPGVLSGVNTATTPVNVSPLSAPNQSAFAAFPSAVSQANSGLSSLAQQVFGAGSSAAPGPNNPSLVGKVSAQTGPTMGFPAYEGASPGLGGFGGHAASPGPTQGSPSVIGPAGPNGPSAFASNMDTAPGPTAAPTANENSLAQAAKTAQAQTNATTTTAPSSPSSQNTAGGPLFQLILGLLGGTPSLNNLARSAGTT
jgi:hypothetical protein